MDQLPRQWQTGICQGAEGTLLKVTEDKVAPIFWFQLGPNEGPKTQ